MGRTWEITGPRLDDVIESAVNTVLSMSLMTNVDIGYADTGDYFEAWVRGDNGDEAIITGLDEDQADMIARAIFDSASRWINDLPSWDGRKRVRLDL